MSIALEAKLLVLAALLVAALIWLHRHDDGIRAIDSAKATQQALAAEVAARATEARQAADVAAINQGHADEIARINASRDRLIAGLRNRTPIRSVSAASAPACDGASPAQLSAADSAVVIGWSAQFDALRADYAACRAWTGQVMR